MLQLPQQVVQWHVDSTGPRPAERETIRGANIIENMKESDCMDHLGAELEMLRANSSGRRKNGKGKRAAKLTRSMGGARRDGTRWPTSTYAAKVEGGRSQGRRNRWMEHAGRL